MDGITLDNVKLFVAHDPASPYDKTVNALTFKQARNLKLRNVEIFWEKPAFAVSNLALGHYYAQVIATDAAGQNARRRETGAG